MYDWGIGFPAASFDGQVYIDDNFDAWSWVASTQSWIRRADLVLRRTIQQALNTKFHDVALQTFWAKASTVYRDWEAYDLAFAELANPSTGVVYGRRAQLTVPELRQWLVDVVPNDGSTFSEDAVLRIYEAVDASVTVQRAYGFNELYAQIRNELSYRSYRRRPALFQWCGIYSYFNNYYNVNATFGRLLSAQLAFMTVGPAPGSDAPNDYAVWMTARNDNLYRRPKTGHRVVNSNNRLVWDTATSTWHAPTSDLLAMPYSVARPMLLFTDSVTPGTLQIATQASQCRLNAILSRRMRMLSITVLNSGTEYAFMVHPAGMTHLALHTGYSLAEWGLVARNTFRSEESNSRRKLVKVQDRTPSSDGWLVDVYDTLYLPATGIVRHTGNAPSSVRLYVRHRVTGVRSEEFNTVLQACRDANVPLYYTTRCGVR